jgi:hypothetical protein
MMDLARGPIELLTAFDCENPACETTKLNTMLE